MSFFGSSSEIKIRLEQHLYTATDPEFETVAKSSGITDEMQHELERNSLYFLPSEMLYEEEGSEPLQTPVKYNFYPIGESHFALGRGVYIGKDAIGRPGNYIFHSFVISKEDFLKLEYQPINIFRELISEGKFLGEWVEGTTTLETLSLGVAPPKNLYSQSVLSLENLAKFIAITLDGKNSLIRGNSEQTLNLAEQVCATLPIEHRLRFHFDSYCYGTGSYTGLNALPEGEFFSDNQTRDFSFNANSKVADDNVQAESTSLNYGSRIAKVIERQSLEKVQRLLNLEDIYQQSISQFLEKIATFVEDQETINTEFYFIFQERLLDAMASGELSLLKYFFNLITDKEPFFANDALMAEALVAGHEQIIDELVIWQANQVLGGQGSALVNHPELWQNFLDYAQQEKIPPAIPIFEVSRRLLELNKEIYREQSELEIYKIIFSQAEKSLLNSDSGDALYSIVKKYDKVDNETLMTLREFFYCIRKDKITTDLIEANLMGFEPLFLNTICKFILSLLLLLEKEKKVKKWAEKFLKEREQPFIEYLLGRLELLESANKAMVKAQLASVIAIEEAQADQ